MLLIRPAPNKRWRVTVFIAVVGLHVLGLLILATGRIRIARLEPSVVPLTFVPFAEQRSPPSDIPNSQANSEASNPKKKDSLKTVAPQTLAEPNNGITLPYVDWYAEAEASGRRKIDDEEAEKRRRNLAGPSESQLEWWRNNMPLGRDHQSGDIEHAEGGELITWVDDKCYFTTHGITTFGMPQTSKVCKDPPKPETELFKDMRKKLDLRDTSRTP